MLSRWGERTDEGESRRFGRALYIMRLISSFYGPGWLAGRMRGAAATRLGVMQEDFRGRVIIIGVCFSFYCYFYFLPPARYANKTCREVAE